MRLSRRNVLKTMALMSSSVLTAGCESLVSETTERLGQAIPEKLAVSNTDEIDPDFHLLNRAAYGAYPGELFALKEKGARAWIEEQLSPEKIDDSLCRLRARRFESLFLAGGDCYDFKKEVLRDDLSRHALLMAVYSKRQLFEVMVEFFTDHLNVNLEKGDCIYLKALDDRSVVRAHALGKFRDLIYHSARSPAMLVYLDGKENRRVHPGDVPNENYARELMELHTLGVDGGYTQRDVFEAARCLTGFRLHEKGDWSKGSVYFDSASHDDGEKHVLGRTITAGGGERDLDSLIDIVTEHPSTSRFISYKLCRHFAGRGPDCTPPPALVDMASEKFRASGGDMKAVLGVILNSRAFNESKGAMIKRPFRFIASSLRVLGADTHARGALVQYLGRMGQGPFQHPTPDGYPEEALPWMGTLMWRWNFALALAANRLDGAKVSLDRLLDALGAEQSQSSKEASARDAELLFAHLVGRSAKEGELSPLFSGSLGSSLGRTEIAGLLLASPQFQRY